MKSTTHTMTSNMEPDQRPTDGCPTEKPTESKPAEKKVVTKPPKASYYPLRTWDEIEYWQKDNNHIRGGYYPSTGRVICTVKSLYRIHNETGNIYTHLVPGLFTLSCLIFLNLSYPLLVFTVGSTFCLICSGVFHLLKSHSEPVSITGNKFDYVGISILIASSMLGIISQAYMDCPKMKLLFTSITLGLGGLCSYVSLTDKFMGAEYRPMRAIIFVSYGLSGALPVLVGFYMFGVAETWERAGLHWLMLEGILYIGGAVLYACRFPERLIPGKVDIIGHSHQIFHVMVVCAAYCHYRCLLHSIEFASTLGITPLKK